MSRKTQFYAYGVIAAGALAVANAAGAGLHVADPLIFTIYLILAVLASMLKMRLPGMEGTYSLNTLFILFGLYYLSPVETMIAGCAAVTVQSLWRAKHRPTLLQIVFNLANVSLSIAAGFGVMHLIEARGIDIYRPALMAAAAFVQFAVNTLIVSGILATLEGKPLREIWLRWYEWSLPYYLIAAALVALVPVRGHAAPPEAWIILLPLLYLVHFFCSLATSARNAGTTGEVAGSGAILPSAAWYYVSAIVGVGAAVLARAAFAFDATGMVQFTAWMALGLLVATWKVRLPGMMATISVGFVVTLFAVAEMPFSQTLMVTAAIGAVQALWKPERRPDAMKTIFSIFCLVVSTAFVFLVVRSPLLPVELAKSLPVMLTIATALLYLLNSLLISVAICLAARKPLAAIWEGCYFWSFPYYLAGAVASGTMVMIARSAGWIPSLFVLPLMGMLYVSYRQHVGKAVARGVALVSAKEMQA